MRDLNFTSHGVRCAAWHIPATTDVLAGPSGRPCMVMAHGFGGTRDTGLLSFAKAFAAAGIDALVFDYRGFGDSEGSPRQDVSVTRQRQDYHAAIAAARHLPGVDPARIALWGTSYSGGHVIAVAAQDRWVAAVVSMTPATDGLAALAQIARYAGVRQILRATGHGLVDAVHAIAKRSPHHVAVVGQPGSVAVISTPGAEEGYLEMAGPTWRNEVCARAALGVALNRPTTFAGRLPCPTLMQIGTYDRVAPPTAARRAAAKAPHCVEVSEYPVDHFDVYVGAWHEWMLADQISFLTEVLGPAQVPTASR